jgi:predicted transglutaminase-like cysteine proteinase
LATGFSLCLSPFSAPPPAVAGEDGIRLTVSEQLLRRAEREYGPDAKKRLLAWRDLMADAEKRRASDRELLALVNRFFNQLHFIDDRIQWRQEDYWATPVEFLASGGGDCEDFAIGKFFTLINMGIAESKLTLTYVKSLTLNQAHMVLSYYAHPDAIPLILDNIDQTVKPATERGDLRPVYSVNGSGLWLAKRRGLGTMIGSGDQLDQWRRLAARMGEQFPQD